MDSDSWATRLAASRRQFTLRHHHHVSRTDGFSQLDRFERDGFEVEEDIRSDFRCPYCFEEFDIASLRAHLEDEHPCEHGPAICPVCSAKVTRDVLNHIILEHGNMFKFQRWRTLRRLPIPNSQALSLPGNNLREAQLQALLGGSTYRSNNAASSHAAAVADPFLSSFVLNFTGLESEEIAKSVMSSIEEISSRSDAALPIWKSSSLDSSLSFEEREERTRQAAGRAVFLQDLLVSTLFSE